MDKADYVTDEDFNYLMQFQNAGALLEWLGQRKYTLEYSTLKQMWLVVNGFKIIGAGDSPLLAIHDALREEEKEKQNESTNKN